MDSDYQFDSAKLLSLVFIDDYTHERNVSFDTVKERAYAYNIPILFAYQAFPPDRLYGDDEDDEAVVLVSGFVVTFLNDVPITDDRIVTTMHKALKVIFPKAIDWYEEGSAKEGST